MITASFPIDPHIGLERRLKAFIVQVPAAVGSISGALVAGILVWHYMYVGRIGEIIGLS